MKYIIYCRKSTDTEDRQVLSLESQENELDKIVKDNNLDVVSILKESKSAKEPGRPIFNQMIKMINSGKADAILCWKIDRLTRNPVDGGQIQWLLQTGKIKCIQTFEKSYFPNDNVLIMSIEQAMANQYIRDLSVNVKRGNRTKLEKGQWPNRAPFGYVNDKLNKSILVDKKMAKYVIRSVELYATGGYSLKQITDILFQEGLRTKSGGKVLRSQIHRFITSKFYSGLMERDGKIYQGNHKALISLKLFNQAQDVLTGKLHSKPKKHFYSARGFLKCDSCGCMLTAETQKGFIYYHCTNGKENCIEHKKYIRSEVIDELLSSLFLKLKFDSDFIEISAEAYKAKNNDKISYTQSSLESLNNELKALLEKELTLTDGYSSKIVREDLYKLKMLEIENKRVEINQQITKIQSKGRVSAITFEQIKNVFIDGNISSEKYLEVSDIKKRHMLEKLLSNATVKDKNVVNYQFKSPYQVLANTPKNCDLQTMRRERDSNSRSF